MNKQRMDIRAIAGFCPEKAVWQMLADVSSELTARDTMEGIYVSPGRITVARDTFLLEKDGEKDEAFMAPEISGDNPCTMEAAVWSLGAAAYFMSTGHDVFGGNGGRFQRERPDAPLPAMPKAHGALTPLVRRCLCHDPSVRPGIHQVRREALAGLEECARRVRPTAKRRAQTSLLSQDSSSEWPEEMREA